MKTTTQLNRRPFFFPVGHI